LEDSIDYSHKKVLLVEDNEMNVMIFSLLLKRIGIQFDVATDGEGAIELFNNNYFDIILTDIHLPKLWGDAMARIIRHHPDTAKANTPIIALTASNLSSEIDNYLAVGINQVLTKPFIEADLRNVFIKYLD
jgi:CheY-like chemotaxis protein